MPEAAPGGALCRTQLYACCWRLLRSQRVRSTPGSTPCGALLARKPPPSKEARIDPLAAANRARGSLPPIGRTPVDQMTEPQIKGIMQEPGIENLGRALLGYLTGG